MSPLSRRSFLAATAALAAAPALGAVGGLGEVDVVIIGAGAAGIAAARRVAAANRRFALIEAADRIGGRCATDTKIFGVPYDLGAHWIHNPDSNPLAKLATGLDIYPAPRTQTLRVGARAARDSELETYLAAVLRALRAMNDLGKAKVDFPASRLLPKDLFDWQSTIEFMMGPLATGKELNEISAFDMARAVDRDSDAFCRQGYGALLAKLAAGLPAQLSTPVDAIYWDKKLAIDTTKGNILARAAIITVSTNVLTSDKIEFIPPLPKRQLDAAGKLALGSYDHIALDMPGNPLGLQKDDMVFEQASGPRTAALLANVSGTSLHLVEVAGAFGRELAAKGEPAMVDFAGEWLSSLFGSNVKRAIKRSHATRWNENPFALGAMSAAGPGNADARKILMEPLGGRVWFAGEALHETQWGTVGGAWESGTRAAEAVLRKLGALNEPKDDKPAKASAKRKRRRRGRGD
jgi:monoamine oxidase